MSVWEKGEKPSRAYRAQRRGEIPSALKLSFMLMDYHCLLSPLPRNLNYPTCDVE